MSGDDRDDEGVRVLHRMIAYVRDEAMRLHILDVALLLDHAEDAMLAFAPTILADRPGFADACDDYARSH
ncbi:hypothetical protein [Lichenibacterium ramalinae]|uniref:Uncharacterized protein n=1 Tax=Lichenibacterium ramalinae TaxID=2316527 RepID=A0A4Q2RD58_9HYPH|nr:hypothetical protein [Lichenibacterium ramalinae]RYB05646.1 hypothetical protein D3272_08585 [Lichenibacterium ramalinae]